MKSGKTERHKEKPSGEPTKEGIHSLQKTSNEWPTVVKHTYKYLTDKQLTYQAKDCMIISFLGAHVGCSSKIQTLCHMTQVLLKLRFTAMARLTGY